jgi:hypothetical protein
MVCVVAFVERRETQDAKIQDAREEREMVGF